MNTTELKPFLYLLLNFLIGWLVSAGYIDGSIKDQVIQEAANIAGLLILIATSLVTLYRVIKHPHSYSDTQTMTHTTVVNPVTQTPTVAPVTTYTIPAGATTTTLNIDSGTPGEQQPAVEPIPSL